MAAGKAVEQSLPPAPRSGKDCNRGRSVMLATSSVRQRNNVKIVGQGSQPMIFAHGFGCDQNMWRWVSPAFEADYRIVLFDHVGAGGSDLRAYDRVKYGTLGGYVADLLEICAAEDLNQAIFV